MLVSDLIPINQETQATVEKFISENKIFGSIDQFISMYNGAFFNPKNEQVAKAAHLIENSYKNVSLANNKIIIESPSEVAIKNILHLVENWNVVVKLKRLATTLLDEGYDTDTKIVFTSTRQGVPLIETLDTTGEISLLTHWTSSKVVNKTADLANNLFTSKLVKDYDGEGESAYLNLSDIIDVNDSFLLDIERTLIEKTFN